MPHICDPAHRKRLNSAERRKRLPPGKIMTDIGLKAGDVLVDIGCGPGFFALPAAERVGPRGRVYGIDISPEMISDLILTARKKHLSNVKAILAPPHRPKLPRGADVYFMMNVLHEVEDRPALLRAVRRSSKKTSRLAIIDFYKKRTKHGPPLRDRISPAMLDALLKKAGFAPVRVGQVNDEEYGVIAVPD